MNEDADIIPIQKAKKTENHKKKKIDRIKEAFEKYLPLNKAKAVKKNRKKKKR